MNRPKLIPLLLLTLCVGLLSRSVQAQDPSGTALVTGCKSGGTVRGYKRPGMAMRAYAHFACGSSVYVWNATAKTILVQQGTTVAYIASKYVYSTGVKDEASPEVVRGFLQAIAEGQQLPDASASSARTHLVQGCLASRGCRVETWSNLAWTRIKKLNQLIESPDSTLRLSAGGVYYNAFVVNPPVRFRDRPLPSLKSPVLVLDGGGLSLAIVDNTCYTLATNGKWAMAGASAVQSVAAMQQ
jgi:hypothetical protein